MAILRALVSFPAVSQDTEDVVTNTWHFDLTTFAEGDITPVETALDAFYTTCIGVLANTHTWTTGRIKWYNLDDAKPRAPLKDTAFVISGTTGGNPLPRECAICVSFQAEQISGISQARRRGRIYLGPIAAAVNNSAGMVAPATLTTIVTACTNLLSASNAASNWAWVIYSPTTDSASPVDNGWVDDAFDTQRRRGVDAGTRSTW